VPLRTSGLAARFHGARRRGEAAEADEPLDAVLQDSWERGHAAWPELTLDAAAFAAYLGERAPDDTAPAAWLGNRCAGDLFLACACVAGSPQAVHTFNTAILDKLEVYLHALRPTPETIAETRQVLLEKLFVGTAGEPPRIRQYRGQGSLEGWVRIAAVRAALKLLAKERAQRPRADEADEIAHGVLADGDPELELLRATYKQDFLDAFRAAIADLSRRHRGLLRLTFIEQLTPAQIGAMYGCHRTTALRWIEAARDQVFAQTRARMMDRLRLSPSECERIILLIRSRIDVTLDALLASES
jgi:RNA polymerase sigma-70 factor, ECF subfamily